MATIKLITIITSVRKSHIFFKQLRWHNRRKCPRCSYSILWKLKDRRYKCRKCSYKFSDFTGTYPGKLNIPINEICHILYLFVLGVSANRIKEYIEVSLKTIHRVFTTVRQAIYDQALVELQEVDISGEVEMDEMMFGGKRAGKRGWGASGKQMIFVCIKGTVEYLRFRFLREIEQRC